MSYNPVTGEWRTLASMLVPRSQMGCVVLDDHLYVLGGTNRHNEILQVKPGNNVLTFKKIRKIIKLKIFENSVYSMKVNIWYYFNVI